MNILIVDDLERLLQQTQGELIDARATNTKLEHQIGKVRSSYGEKFLTFERSNNEMILRIREANNQVNIDSYKDN